MKQKHKELFLSASTADLHLSLESKQIFNISLYLIVFLFCHFMDTFCISLTRSKTISKTICKPRGFFAKQSCLGR